MAITKAQTTPTNDIGEMTKQDSLQDWDRIAPVGREFGSPDYERLEELDHLAFLAKGSLLAARRWLDTPNQALEGMTPEEVAKTPEGFARVRQLLTSSTKAR